MTDFDSSDRDDPLAPPAPASERPPPLVWRFVAVPLLAWAAFGLLALVSYHAADVPWLHASGSATVSNWMGRAGACQAYALLLLFGLPAYAIPLAAAAFGLAMLFGRHLRFRPLWAALLLLNACALFQFLSEPLADLLASPRFNLAPNAGGGVGALLNHPDMPLAQWIGTAGTAALNVAFALLWLLLLAGPRSMLRAWRRERARRAEIRAEAEDRTIANRPDLEADESSAAAAAAERRAERESAAAAREAAREAARAAKADEKARRKAEKELARAALLEEKARRKAEKEAARAAARARRIADDDDDDIFAGGAAAPAPAELAPPEPAPTEPAPADPAFPAPPVPTVSPIPPASPASPVSPIPPASPVSTAPTVSTAPLAPPASPDSSAEDGPFPPSPVDFKLPTTRLLHPLPPETAQDNSAEVAERSRIIEDTLAEFGLNGAVTHVVCGPTITRYEVKPAQGVKVDRIQGVHSNLQMKLKAKSLRIIAPIPGKDVVGLEVPNIKSRAVPLRGIAESPEWKAATEKMALPMLLSRDIDGAPVIADLAKMPHMIVAGTTGSGKSVTLNGILAGWLLSRTPDQLRLILVDPKRVEFTPYADIPHLVVPVITEAPKVAVCLQWAVKEMDRRLKLFQSVGVRNIDAFNHRTSARQGSLFGLGGDGEGDGAPATLPYVAIVIDEMSDLMMLAGADVEPRVVRLAQLARAAGIHLIIATQRPDVKVITGKIKANFPARIALKVASAMDSMTIIDQGGAQTLIGRGDMLFLNPNSSAGLQRSQSCWIDDEEIAALTQWYRDQGDPMYVPDIKAKLDRIKVKDATDTFKTFESEEGGDAGGEDGGGDAADGEEALLQKCLDVIVSADRASTSMLQRKLRLGYNKAARIMDELEQRGCIGPANGAAPRDILRTTLADPSAGADEGGADDGEDDPDAAPPPGDDDFA